MHISPDYKNNYSPEQVHTHFSISLILGEIGLL